MEDKIISYKGMDSKMQCRGMQYEVGKEFSVDGDIECCGNGLHACERPLDVFGYYAPGTGARYFRVEQSGEMARDASDSKVASRKMRVDAEIGIPGLVKAHIEYVKTHTTTEHTDPERATAGYRGAATAGYRGAATAGNCGAATAGDSGAATAGNCGAATAGDSGAATAGYRGAATAGNCGAATAGYCGAATAGDSGAATSRGSASVGANGIACARSDAPMARGGMGAVLVLVEEPSDSYNIAHWKAVEVDGKTVKADTWYRLVDGKLVEAGDDE
jgi:hypothetical protein